MFTNRREFSKNGTKSLPYSEYAVYNSVERGNIFNPTTNRKRMEKLFLAVLTWAGVTSYLGAILLNVGNWKADVLWFIACLFGVVKFIRYSLKTWQDYRRGELEIKSKRKEMEEN